MFIRKFLKLMQFKGVIDCDNTVLRQFNIDKLIILNYSLPATDCRNIQPYTLSCIAVEPSESIQLKIAAEEKVDVAIKHSNKWIKYARHHCLKSRNYGYRYVGCFMLPDYHRRC